MKTQTMKHNQYERGVTLLELIVVMSILAVMAASSYLVVSDSEDQRRHELTVARHKVVKEAILGPEQLVVTNNTPIQVGYVHDLGQLPESLEQLVESDADLKVWSRLGSELISTEPDRFTDLILGEDQIKINDGWNGPYVNEPDDEEFEKVADGWEKQFQYVTTDAAAGAEDAHFRLYSFGKDKAEGANGADATEYDADYPEGDAQKVFRNRYAMTPVAIPSELTIKVPASQVANIQNIYVGVLYPGLDLSEKLEGSVFVEGSGGSKPTHEALDTGFSAGQTVSVDELLLTNDGEDKVYRMATTTGKNLYFNKPLARRYQIAVFLKGQPSEEQGFDTLASAILGVYPQVFTFEAGTNPTPGIGAGGELLLPEAE